MPLSHTGQYHAYGKNNDDETKRKLLSKGVSREAIATTLELQGMLDLRKDIKSERYTANNQWVLFHPAPDTNRVKFLSNLAFCDLAYQLFIKENILYGNFVYNASLQNLNLAMNEQGTYIDDTFELPESHMADSAREVILAIDDLYIYPDTQPLDYSSRQRQSTIERYLRYSTTSLGYTLVTQSIVHPSAMKYDWTDRFIKDLICHSEIVTITAPNKKRK